MIRVAIFNDTSAERHHGCNAVMAALVAGLRRHGMEPAYYWPVGPDWRQHRDMLAAIDVDAVVVNGEGSIHNSATRLRSQFLPQLSDFARNTLGVPSFLINCTLYNIDPDTLAHIAAFDRIFVRESGSLRYLDSLGIRATLVPDLSVVSMEPEDPAPRLGGLLVTDSVYPEVSAQLAAFARGRGTYRSMVLPRSLSLRIRHRILREIGRPPPILRHRLRDTSNYPRFVRDLRRRAVVLTGRFHTATLCLTAATPFVAVESNTPKIGAMLKDVFGNTDRLLGEEALDDATLAAAIKRHAHFSTEEAHAVNNYVLQARREADSMFAQIAEMVTGSPSLRAGGGSGGIGEVP